MQGERVICITSDDEEQFTGVLGMVKEARRAVLRESHQFDAHRPRS